MTATSVLIDVPKNRNKIEIQKICPSVAKSEFKFSQNSLLGISINSPSLVGNKILAIFNFLSKHNLKPINLLIGDSLYRYTAMLKDQCNEEVGKEIGLEQGQHLEKYYLGLCNEYGNPYNLNIYFTSQIEKDLQFPIIYANLWKLFETDSKFRHSVLNFSNYYFNRALNSSGENSDYNQYAYKYLIEELTALAVLNLQGFNTLIYPGVIQTIYDVITMDEPYLKYLFENYSFVSLRITRR